MAVRTAIGCMRNVTVVLPLDVWGMTVVLPLDVWGHDCRTAVGCMRSVTVICRWEYIDDVTQMFYT